MCRFSRGRLSDDDFEVGNDTAACSRRLAAGRGAARAHRDLHAERHRQLPPTDHPRAPPSRTSRSRPCAQATLRLERQRILGMHHRLAMLRLRGSYGSSSRGSSCKSVDSVGKPRRRRPHKLASMSAPDLESPAERLERAAAAATSRSSFSTASAWTPRRTRWRLPRRSGGSGGERSSSCGRTWRHPWACRPSHTSQEGTLS